MVSVFSFTYSVAFIVICMVAVCVSACTYLLSHRRVYLAIAAFFFFNMLEGFLALLDEYQRQQLRFSASSGVSEEASRRVVEARFSSFCDVRGISERERDVLEQLLEGADNRTIAESLFILIGTVKSHAHAIYRKCGVSSRTELIQSFWAD